MQAGIVPTRSPSIERSWAAFVAITVAVLWLDHAIAFFLHEFAHSFTAWALGWKLNPLNLNYGSTTVANLLLQVDIDENVDYVPIFSSAHGIVAGIIAVAGVVGGNAIISLGLGLLVHARARKHGRVVLAYVGYWLVAMSVGNLLSYVPLRVFASHADMHTAALGFACSPLALLLLLGAPFLAATLYFLGRFAPSAVAWMFPLSPGRRATVVVLTSCAVFGFFGAAGLGSGGVSHALSLVFVAFLLPASIVFGLWMEPRARATT